MIATAPADTLDVGLPLDELSLLELRIARRADELAARCERDPGYDYWETAERELLPESLRTRG